MMSLASVDLAIVQVASTVAEHLCSLIFSQNYFQIQSQEGKISKFFWGHALDHALSKCILSMFRSLSKLGQHSALHVCITIASSYLAMVMHTTYERDPN